MGTQILTEAGEYEELFPNVNGCDSLVKLTLNVRPIFNESKSISICQGESYILGNQTLSTSGVFSEVFQTQQYGCDSTVLLTLDFTTLNPVVAVEGAILSVEEESEVIYQWVSCDDYSPIQHATLNSYEVESTGSYAIKMTQANCEVTSDCVEVAVILDVVEDDVFEDVAVYPIPTQNKLTIDFNHRFSGSYELMDMSGKIVIDSKKVLDQTSFVLDIEGKEGVYIVRLNDEKGNFSIFKVLKQ